MSAVGELVLGERRGRWLVAAAACAGLLALSAAPGAGDGRGDPRNPADHLRQRQRSAAGRVRQQPYRRVLLSGRAAPASAGLNIATTDAAAPGPFEVDGFLGSSFTSVSAPDASAVTAARATRGSLSTSYQTDAPNTGSNVRRRRDPYVRERHDRRGCAVHRDVQRRQSRRCSCPRLRGRRPLRRRERRRRRASSIPARPARWAASTRPREARVGSSSSRPWDALPGGAIQRRVQRRRHRPGRLQRHDRLRRCSTTASACSGTRQPWLRGPANPPDDVALQPLHRPDLTPRGGCRSAQGQIATATVDGAQQRRQPGSRPPRALRDHRAQLRRRRGDDGRRRHGHDHAGSARTPAPTRSPRSSTSTATACADADEPEQTATVVWGAPPPPVPGKSVVGEGRALAACSIKYPPGYTRAPVAARCGGLRPVQGRRQHPGGARSWTPARGASR